MPVLIEIIVSSLLTMLRSIWQPSTAVGILCHFNHLESKTVATSRTSESLHQCNASEYLMHENRLMARSREQIYLYSPWLYAKAKFLKHLSCDMDMGLKKMSPGTWSSCVYDTPFASIYRDFTIPRLRQFTEILWCPVCVNLQQCNSQTFYVRRPITVKCL